MPQIEREASKTCSPPQRIISEQPSQGAALSSEIIAKLAEFVVPVPIYQKAINTRPHATHTFRTFGRIFRLCVNVLLLFPSNPTCALIGIRGIGRVTGVEEATRLGLHHTYCAHQQQSYRFRRVYEIVVRACVPYSVCTCYSM